MRFIKFHLIGIVGLGLYSNPVLAQSSEPCNENTYINSSDPNTIEYDSMISLYHATLIKEISGKVKVWGDKANPNGYSAVLSPREVTVANGYNYQGSILKTAAGSRSESGQFIILTTNGLYAWGSVGTVLHGDLTSNSSAFSKVLPTGTANVSGTNAFSLPMGVQPSDVKMMFGSYQTLAIVTHSEKAYVLTLIKGQFGDGAGGGEKEWHQVHKSDSEDGGDNDGILNKIVAVRGNSRAFMALTKDSKVYTWGENTFLGNGSNSRDRKYATQMTLPVGVTPKMIGMTGQEEVSYFLLSTTGVLYSLGKNAEKQLGDFTTTDRSSWVRVKKSAAANDFLPTIVWVSPNEHDSFYSAVNALTTNGKLWSWGNNEGNMIGGAVRDGFDDPFTMGRTLDPNDRLTAVETGGHTTMIVKQCSRRFGYVGHRTDGSMGDGTNIDRYEIVFNFIQTAIINLCGAPTAPNVQNLEVCPGETSADLDDAIVGGDIPLGYGIEWWSTINRQAGTKVTNTRNTPLGTYYAFLIPSEGNCENPVSSDPVRIFTSNIQLTLLKSSVFVDQNSNGYANVGDYITYTLTVRNTGPTTVNSLELNDSKLGLRNEDVIPGTLAPGEQASRNFNYNITLEDVQNKGVYNLAIVDGKTALDCDTEQTSVDPNPLRPGDPGYDPTRPNHTYTFLPGPKLLITNPNIYQRVRGN